MRGLSRGLVAVGLWIGVCCLSSVAFAEGETAAQPASEEAPWALDLGLILPKGLGSAGRIPTGDVGVNLTRELGDYFALSGGVGWGGGGSLNVSLMPRVQLHLGPLVTSLGVGATFSPSYSYEDSGCGFATSDECRIETGGPVVFGHAELSVLYQTGFGLRFGLILGYANVLYLKDFKAEEYGEPLQDVSSEDADYNTNNGSWGLILGYAF